MTQYTKLSIKQLSVEDRPREKLINKGISALSDAELIAITLGSGSQRESALELARKIMAGYQNNLKELGKAGIDELTNKFHGVGNAKAISIVAAMELGRRQRLHESATYPVIKCSNDVYNIVAPIIADLPHEEFWTLMLNRANKVIGRYNVSKGGINGTVIDVRLIMKRAVEQRASSVIISHNHPSGNLNPSSQDINITKKIKEAGKIMDIPLLDHLIITENGYFSFADEGVL
ncbi:DNA repair protein RadC [Marinilabiliaceae bacterium ANBcel2]|nr:DNA repair protein RadC [Marinilabiliaceae bacterium ANBcel2]